ncbi:MAG: hypothetical protein RhofKO_32150 [Rhodothermales bacterium]
MKRLVPALHLIAFLVLTPTASAQTIEKLEDVIGSYNYSVPSSPAFTLLPGKESQVIHLTSPQDITANLLAFAGGGLLGNQVAFDVRPLSFVQTDINEYQASLGRQVAWRTVFSAGLTRDTDKQNPNDMLGAIGLRIPLIDRSDPRLDPELIAELDQIIANGTVLPGQIPIDSADSVVLSDITTAYDEIIKAQDEIVKAYAKANWNRFKWDIGLGFMWRAQSGIYDNTDSLGLDRYGAWTAVGFPTPSFLQDGQTDFSLGVTGTNRSSNSEELTRIVAGARTRVITSKDFGLSVEAAHIWSRYGNGSDLNENWTHLALLLEVKLAGSWLGFVYGGDTANRENPSRQFGFSYAVYPKQLINR